MGLSISGTWKYDASFYVTALLHYYLFRVHCSSIAAEKNATIAGWSSPVLFGLESSKVIKIGLSWQSDKIDPENPFSVQYCLSYSSSILEYDPMLYLSQINLRYRDSWGWNWILLTAGGGVAIIK